ncbi:hypothetical protein [Paenibacillus odorifer]|uniref:Uncharacterized protein n=1 Tax=Paenibacillus odorifer TaxID=189426 RepID=A0A1R0WSV9_9BACL|nr:hypothetical protein [Paenibacillus odorifer]OMD20344.1 hypothetical protein BJP51_09685 [Paenibacillus odorifer]
MIFTIKSMQEKGKLKEEYYDILKHNLDWKKSYDEQDDVLIVELSKIEELFSIFAGLEMQMGYGGHITIDFQDSIIYILDSWIE